MPQPISSRIPAILTLLLLAASTLAGEVRLVLTHQGQPPLEPEMIKFYVHEPDQDSTYVGWGHATRSARVPDGTYDIRVRFERGFVVRTRLFEDVEVSGTYSRRVDFNVPLAALSVDVTRDGLPASRHGARIAVYQAGKRDRAIGKGRPREEMWMRPGRYDLEITALGADGRLESTWLNEVEVSGYATTAVTFGGTPAVLTVTLTEGGRPVAPDRGSWTLYARGERDTPLGKRGSGLVLSTQEGRYDLLLELGEGEERRERWVENLRVEGEVSREFEFAAPDSLRVAIRDGERPVDGSWFDVYRRGERRRPIASGVDGDEVDLESGRYDVAVYMRDRGFRRDLWFTGQRVRGATDLQVELAARPAYLKVEPRRRSRAQPTAELWFVVDRSALAAGGWYDEARSAIDQVLDGRGGVEVGVITFGGSGSEGCNAVETVAEPRRANASRAADALRAALGAGGEAPLPQALRQLPTSDDGTERSLVVLTTTPGSCGGDACDIAGRLLRNGAFSRSFVLGLGVARSERPLIDCIGRYRDVSSVDRLTAAVGAVVRDATADVDGTVSIFAPSGGPLVQQGPFGEGLPVVEGRYEVISITGGDRHRWRSLEISGAVELQHGRNRPR